MSATEPRRHDDRTLPVTRIVAVALVPFLVVAAFLLFAFPERSGELFAWPIDPPLSAAVLASAYVGGVWFFARVPTRRWHEVRHGFPAVAVFAGALLIATLLHLDRFSSNLSFAAWMVLYATTPFIAVALAVIQRPRDDGIPMPGDLELPRPVRIGLVAIGLSAMAAGVVLFLAPQTMAAIWAWTLTPLTAQVTGAVLTLPGVVSLGLVRDSRWSAFRVLVQAQLLSLVAMAVSLFVHRDDLHADRWTAPLFVALIGIAIVAYTGLLVWCEARLRRAHLVRTDGLRQG